MAKEYTLNVQGYYRDVSKTMFPNVPAIFFIYKGTFNAEERTCSLKQLLYVGETSDLLECASHVENDYALDAVLDPDEAFFYTFSIDYTDEVSRKRIVDALVYELRPVFNRVNPNAPRPAQTTIIVSGNKHAFVPARIDAPSF